MVKLMNKRLTAEKAALQALNQEMYDFVVSAYTAEGGREGHTA